MFKESMSFRLIQKQHIVAVYGQCKPERFFHEIVLSYITWSTSGMIIAYVVRDMVNPLSVYYISCFTTISIMILWACTLNKDSICLWIDVTAFFCNTKTKIRSSQCSLLSFGIVFFTFYIINFAFVIYNAFTPYNTVDLYTISDNSKLITACLSTLVVLNIQKIFDFYPEERRQSPWEIFVFVLLCVINTCLGASNFNQCTLFLSPWFDSLVFPVSGFIPIDSANLCLATNETLTKMTIMNMTTVHNMTFSSGDMVTQPLIP